MNKLALAALVLLSACSGNGVPDPTEVFKPTQGCIGPYRAPKGFRINQDAVLENEALLKNLYEHPWTDGAGVTHEALISDDKEFCERFGGVTIDVITADEFSCPAYKDANGNDLVCAGETTASGIKLARTGEALLHEFLHVYQMEHVVLNTATHPHWEELGYHYLGYTLYWYHARTDIIVPE